jgi:trans-aconitate methyltransferase
MPRDVWESGESYERFVGRWSRLVAREFLLWLNPPHRATWLDVGCGTGAISHTILETYDPDRILGLDPSPNFVRLARLQISDDRASFQIGDAQALCIRPAAVDVAVSGLVLNFVPDPRRMLDEAAQALRPSGLLGVYVWDYKGKMEMLRYFWEAAAHVDPTAADLDEGRRFPLCQPGPLRALLSATGLEDVEAEAIEVSTTFAGFDEYWTPFLGGQGAAPSYAATLTEDQRAQLREHLRRNLPFEPDGSIRLVARAWAAKGRRPD